MKIHEILVEFQLQKNQWAVDISNDAKQEVSGDLIHLVQTAYAGTPRGSFVNNVSNILPSDWAILDFDDEPDVDSAVFYRGPRPGESWTGFKIQGLGHDGTRPAKEHALSKMIAMLNRPGWWIESSGTLRSVLANRGCNIVQDPATLQSLFPDSGLEMINQNTYTRQLPDGASITETVFGHPKVSLSEETLAELTGIKDIVSKLPKPRDSRFDPLGIDWHTVLNNYGFKVLGYGSFGVVWENPKLPYVLKVFSAKDSAYIDWISVARQNKSNPHMPRFVSAQLLKITPEVLAIRMEKLFPVINQEKNVVFESDMLLQERYNPSEQVKSVGFDTDQRNLRYYCQTHPTWLPALDIVKNFSNNSGYRLDFHNKNVMMRDADTLVITDPVYSREDLAGR